MLTSPNLLREIEGALVEVARQRENFARLALRRGVWAYFDATAGVVGRVVVLDFRAETFPPKSWEGDFVGILRLAARGGNCQACGDGERLASALTHYSKVSHF